jgi:hypothetical protein
VTGSGDDGDCFVGGAGGPDAVVVGFLVSGHGWEILRSR